jgi:hypothetical protein
VLLKTMCNFMAFVKKKKYTYLFFNYRNLEDVEKLKIGIEGHKDHILTTNLASERTAVEAIRESLIELLLKLQEVDECVEHQTKKKVIQPTVDLPDIIAGVISTSDLVELLETKIKLGMIASGQRAIDLDSGVEEDDEGIKVLVFSI